MSNADLKSGALLGPSLRKGSQEQESKASGRHSFKCAALDKCAALELYLPTACMAASG